MLRTCISVAAFVTAAACAPTSAPVATAPAAPAAPATLSAPATPDIRWVRDSAEHHAALYQVYRLATARVEQAAAGQPAGSWAVILDADETVLDNSLYQLERFTLRLGFTAESWNGWVKRREATPLPGAAAFLARVRALGGKIAIVTNRLQSECEDTRAVFDAHQLVFDAMLCRADGAPSDKTPRFDAVAKGASPAGSAPLQIVAFVGDNILDFPRLAQAIRSQGAPAFSEFGVRYFLVPNPMYGSWQ
jgi:5'-nucleotidase (lipoprotein e(P4) family)